MSELDQLSLLEEYRATRETLYDSLKTIDLYDNGDYKPQYISTADWTELESSPGVFIKNVKLVNPDSFVISVVHGLKGAVGDKHTIFDDLELYISIIGHIYC